MTPVDSAPLSLPMIPSGFEKEADELGQASVYIHKRSSETANDILQALVGPDSRQMRLGGGARILDLGLIEQTLSEHGKAELLTDTYR